MTEPLDERVLVLAPTARDAAYCENLLEAAGISHFLCNTIADICRELGYGAGAAVVTAEAVLGDREELLAGLLKVQPPWSDFPLIVLIPPGTESPRLLQALDGIGHMTLMQRPVQVSALVSAAQTALRDRRRQYTVRDLLVERQRTGESLRQADRNKDEFIALLAHELRNPLAPLRNGLQVMRLAGGDPAAISSTRDIMERQLGHMVRLIDDLLDISRISQNKMELRRSRVLLADIVSSAVETAHPLIEAEGHELTVSLPQKPVPLDADLTRLAQVFSNLLTNSAKYTAHGGHIWLSAERRGENVAVSVRDTGIGIPAESLGNIFDMFSQVDRSIERSTGGLGIGLSLVRGLVEMHGGTVIAESPGQGRGSTFTIILPVLTALPEPAPAAVSDNGQTPKRPKRRILVVDDNRDGADSLAMILRLIGNEVRTAHDGVDAAEQAEVFRPEVILMDVGMPRLNGLDATRRIREQPWGRQTTIIALTGWGHERDKEQSRAAGCDGHLVKPVNLPDLEKLLAEVQGNGD